MTPAEIRAARKSLGLTQAQLAALLETDPRQLRAMESAPDTATHRKPPPRAVRLIRAYLAGWTPEDWPVGK